MWITVVVFFPLTWIVVGIAFADNAEEAVLRIITGVFWGILFAAIWWGWGWTKRRQADGKKEA